jgi:adenylate kinase
MKLILLGPPGSGKGTVTEALKEKYLQLKHISAGVLLRREIKNKTQIGEQVKEIVEKGDLVPAKIISELMCDEIGSSKHFIFDGFPRSMDQIQYIEHIAFDMLLSLEVPEDIVVERLSARREDPTTGKIYNLKFNPAPPEIQGRLLQREDDSPNAIKERFKVFLENTQPVINFYLKKGIVTSIDATKPIKDVQNKALGAVEKIAK